MGNTVEVKKYKSEHEFAKDAEKMIKKGWHMEGQSSRTKNWSLMTGFLTNKGITTVTWVKGPIPDVSPSGVQTESTGGVTLVLASVPQDKETRKRVNHTLLDSEGLIAHGLKGPTSSLGFRERFERLGELAKLVKAASEGTPQVVGKYEAERAESLANELRQAGATVEIQAPKSLPPADGANGGGAPNEESAISKLRRLAELREAGIVTVQEFEAKKAELLAQV